MDPREWDLNRLLAAFEATLRRGAKDETEWKKLRSTLTAEPRAVREERRQAAVDGRAAPAGGSLSLKSVEALMARMAAEDAMYG